ncbi:MAG: hypothetical protein EZS28_011582 [Streblomastix strix]|uniref:Uncharacterized protein n=1 Tax=Streblomastix strix TaxID=222440 RepID=A0A5J4WDZ5_9EUKA|nr:MAG: hypothetical protein EZS28_011582 [Streblomastix strix]
MSSLSGPCLSVELDCISEKMIRPLSAFMSKQTGKLALAKGLWHNPTAGRVILQILKWDSKKAKMSSVSSCLPSSYQAPAYIALAAYHAPVQSQPHNISQARAQYGNPIQGTNIILYTQANHAYTVVSDGNGGVILPGLSAFTLPNCTENNQQRERFQVSNKVTFIPDDCTVHVDSRAYRTEGDHKGSHHGFNKHRRRYHDVKDANVSVIIPSGRNYGTITWGGKQKQEGQTVIFSAPNGFDAQIPSISIRR